MEINSLNLYFVVNQIKSKDCYSDDMQRALKCCENLKLNCQLVPEERSDLLNNLNPTDILVFDEFSGNIFARFQGPCKNLVISLRYLVSCLTEDMVIPSSRYPLFTVTMSGLIVTASGVSCQEKDRIKRLVHYMGGIYSNHLTKSTTHVIAATVKSEKYFKARELGIPVMTPNWVAEMWKQCCIRDVTMDEPLFNKFKCSVFYNLTITCSKLSKTQRTEVSDYVNENGGRYTADMDVDNTDILIIGEPSGDKYRSARRCNIPCVKPSWIYECIEKGYAIRYKNYLLEDKPQCSTPTEKNEYTSSFCKTQVGISVIRGGCEKRVITDTPSTSRTALSFNAPEIGCATPKKGMKRSSADYRQILKNFDMREATRGVLDGCKVFLTGFEPSEEEKLKRILNYGGAIRFTDLNDSVTHVVVGEYRKSDEHLLNSFSNRSHVVSLEWLRDSLKEGRILPEVEYNFVMRQDDLSSMEQPSPLSRKGLQILTPQKGRAQDISQEEMNPLLQVDENLIRKYSCESDLETHRPVQQRNVSSDRNVLPDEQRSVHVDKNPLPPVPNGVNTYDEMIFTGLKFRIIDHDLETTNKIVEKVTLHGGGILMSDNCDASPTHVVVPVNNTTVELEYPSSKIVTFIWLNDCLCNKRLVPVEYYHRPTTIPQWENLPLADCVITFSAYNPAEKMFIEHIAVALGATCQDVLSKKVVIKAKALKTTHLICPVPEGEKYRAAKKWNLPVVTKEWLFQCLKFGTKVPLDEYFVPAQDKGISSCLADGNIARQDEISKNVTTTTKIINATTAVTPNDIVTKIMGKNQTENGRIQDTTPKRLPSTKTFADISSAFKSTTKRSARMKVDSQSSQFPPLHLEHCSQEESLAKVSVATSNVTTFTTVAVTTAVSTSTVTVTAVSRTVTAVTSRSKDKSEFASPLPIVPLVDAVDAQVDSRQSTPDVLLQQMKQITELLSNPSAAAVPRPKDKVARFPFSDPSRCEKRKFIEEEQQQQQVLWDDALGSGLKKVKMVNGEEQVANTTDYDQLLACFDIPDENEKNVKSLSAPLTAPRPVSSPEPKIVRNFVLTSFSDPTEKKNIEEQIKKLGGNVLNSNHYENETTHLITNRLIKNEKVLCCMAAGKWILHPSYVQDSGSSKKFLNEEDYEWGNDNVKNRYVPSKDTSLRALADACVRWRRKINSSTTEEPLRITWSTSATTGAFCGMKAVFFTDTAHSVAFSKVINAGGGTVLKSDDVLNATHIFVGAEDKYVKNIPVPLKLLADRKVHVLSTSYLNDYLVQYPPPVPESCYLDAYKNIIS